MSKTRASSSRRRATSRKSLRVQRSILDDQEAETRQTEERHFNVMTERTHKTVERCQKLQALQDALAALEFQEVENHRQTLDCVRSSLQQSGHIRSDGHPCDSLLVSAGVRPTRRPQSAVSNRSVEVMRMSAQEELGFNRVFARKLTAYKAVAVVLDAGNNVRLFSIYDGETEYILGRPMSSVGGQGFFCHLLASEASDVKVPRESKLRGARRVIIRCVMSGNGWRKGNKYAFPNCTPVAVIDESGGVYATFAPGGQVDQGFDVGLGDISFGVCLVEPAGETVGVAACGCCGGVTLQLAVWHRADVVATAASSARERHMGAHAACVEPCIFFLHINHTHAHRLSGDVALVIIFV
ncbi:hypothetical protein CYMTET_40893 [Cymbomonas tetramitiformis]|uniref:Uncharacterized protein n=1 Tax=Cymbomonas tetramitiformis TaxID=36881 RepID=A0AAE0C751_9CHLO|nr:hypothetical protein CYMTET_40893 [Cymbomonas tetramitiformis]